MILYKDDSLLAGLRTWLSTPELAALLGMAPGTVRGWPSGHCPRPGFELERRKDGASVWWKVCDAPDPTLALEPEGTVAS